jgi:1-acyl-sn-glycerol-3-phosphate acyltransferase
MWFTLLILLDLWLAHWFISWVISLELVAALPDAAYWIGIPLAYYWGPRLPEWRALRTWRFWGWVRRVYFYGTELPLRAPHHRDGQVLYVAWPHGVYAEAVSVVLLTSEAFADVLPVCSSVLFAIPILRELASLMGAVHANAHDIQAALAAGRSLIILPEGMRGAMGAPPRELMATRKGYIRVAQRARCRKPLLFVPVHIFYTQPTYHVVPFARPLQLWMLRWLRYPFPLIHWGYAYSFLPRRQRITFLLRDPIHASLPEESIHEAIQQGVE